MSNIGSITYEGAKAVTQSDSVDDPAGPFAGFYSGSGGTIKVTTLMGDTASFASVPAGIVMTVAVRRIWSTTTNATGMLGMIASPYVRAASS